MGYKYRNINGVRVLEHRYIMEQHLGRKLFSNECVHHKDKDKSNNRLSNLEVKTLSQHSRDHQLSGDLNRPTVEEANKGRKTQLKERGKRVEILDESFKLLLTVESVGVAARITGVRQQKISKYCHSVIKKPRWKIFRFGFAKDNNPNLHFKIPLTPVNK